mgnify:CR=1 FL=1
MPWKLAVDPAKPAPSRVHDPERCMNCGHPAGEHEEPVGCLVAGGTKYIADDQGAGRWACSCGKYVPAPEREN